MVFDVKFHSSIDIESKIGGGPGPEYEAGGRVNIAKPQGAVRLQFRQFDSLLTIGILSVTTTRDTSLLPGPGTSIGSTATLSFRYNV